MSDLIDKEKFIYTLIFSEKTKSIFVKDLRSVIEVANEMPSAEPERKKGKWQRRKGGDCWECSECHAVLESDDIVRHNFYYCYHCGADMTNEDGYMKLEGTEHE